MDITTYLYTNRGGRINNEDFAAYNVTEYGRGSYVLADGLGGHESGEVASRLAVKFIIAASSKINEHSDKNLIKILDLCNEYLLTKQKEDEKLKAMRTTIVAAFTTMNTFKYFNVGDSRLYYFKNGKMYKQSKDHSVSQIAVDLGEIHPLQMRLSEDRNKLLKALGNEELLKINSLEKEIVMESGDAFLLCSDGFWEYVYETEMEIDLLKAVSPKQWLEYMVKRLIARAKCDNDNFTAVCSFVT